MTFSIRDAFWLPVLCLVLGVWGWDRGRLSQRIQSQQAPTLSQSQQAAVQALGSLQVPPGGTFDSYEYSALLVPQSASDPFAPGQRIATGWGLRRSMTPSDPTGQLRIADCGVWIADCGDNPSSPTFSHSGEKGASPSVPTP